MILIASSRGTGLLMNMFTLPWTKLSITSFLPVSCSYKCNTSCTSLFGYCNRTVFAAPGGAGPGGAGGGGVATAIAGTEAGSAGGALCPKAPTAAATKIAALQENRCTVLYDRKIEYSTELKVAGQFTSPASSGKNPHAAAGSRRSQLIILASFANEPPFRPIRCTPECIRHLPFRHDPGRCNILRRTRPGRNRDSRWSSDARGSLETCWNCSLHERL